MITKDKGTDVFCIIDEFDKNLTSEMRKITLPALHRQGRQKML